ncbi:uncharacterized protein LOC135218929 [Macrobrachium nipponense]|uniref:uncharacterized protein LOC135218929 n=1 Tax=Macrobrachium nipponense TaxID=159736 RepID=UPI0030C8CB85
MAKCRFTVVLVIIMIAASSLGSSLGRQQLPSRTNLSKILEYELTTSRYSSQESGDGDGRHVSADDSNVYGEGRSLSDGAKSVDEDLYVNGNGNKSGEGGTATVVDGEPIGEGAYSVSDGESVYMSKGDGKSNGKDGRDESDREAVDVSVSGHSSMEGGYLRLSNLSSDGESDHGVIIHTGIEEGGNANEEENIKENRQVSHRQAFKRHSKEAILNAQSSGASTVDSIVNMVLRQVNGSQESTFSNERDYSTEFLDDDSSYGLGKLPLYNVTEFVNVILKPDNVSSDVDTDELQPTTLFYAATSAQSTAPAPTTVATIAKKRPDQTRRSSSLSETCEAEWASKTPLEHHAEEDRVIDVAVIVPCNASHQYSRVKVLPVVELAVRHVRETGLRGPLANYTINVRYRDSKTSSTDGPLAAVDLYFNKAADVFLGPVDDYVLAPVARFSGRWNVPLLTPGGQPSAFDSRKDYPLLTRLKGFYTEVGQLFSSVVKHWGWKVLGIIYEENDHDKGHSVCYFTLASIYKTFDNKPHFEKFSRSTTRFDDLLIRFQDKARILVVCASPENVRRLMLAAAGLNMVTSGDYAFFNIEIFSGTSANNKPWYNASDTNEINEIAKKAYEAVLTVTARTPSGDQFKNFSTHVKQIAEKEFGYRYDEESVNPYVAGFFEGVLVYAAALNSTLRDGGSMKNGKDIIKHLWNRTFDANVVPPWFTGSISIDAEEKKG